MNYFSAWSCWFLFVIAVVATLVLLLSFLVFFLSFFEMPMIKTCCGAMCVTKPLIDLVCLVICTNYKSVVHPTWHTRSISGIVISVPNLSI
jgi:hypothetical protein